MDFDFGKIYHDHKDHIYNYIYRLCGDHHQAQDVVQQAFIKLMSDPGLDKVQNIKSYLFTISRNHLYDTWKKKKETLVDEAGLELIEPVSEGEMSDALAKQQLQTAVSFCINRLTDKYRDLTILRYIEDLSIKEIAGITNFSESDIKVSLLRAKNQFDIGLTQHMYLKVAKTRQQCNQMNSMLAPYKDQDIPEADLASFEKHMSSCELCAEDAEEMKRKRKLFAIVPLVAAPLSLDTAFNDAVAATSSSTINTGSDDLANSTTNTGKAGMMKIATGVGGAVLIVAASVFLLPDSKPTAVTNQHQLAPKNVAVSPAAKDDATKSKSNKPGTTFPLTASMRLTPSSAPVKSYWTIRSLDKNNNVIDRSVYATISKKLDTKLLPGKYKLIAKIDKTIIERIIHVGFDHPQHIDIVANGGEISITTKLPENIGVTGHGLYYAIYKSKQDLERHKKVGTYLYKKDGTKATLPAGDYIVKLVYSNSVQPIDSTKTVTINAGKTSRVNFSLGLGIFKPVTILSGKNLPYKQSVHWSIERTPETSTTKDKIYRKIIDNGNSATLLPGEYIFTAKLGNIEQSLRAKILTGKLLPPRFTLKGGILRSVIWSNKAKTIRNRSIYTFVYNFDEYNKLLDSRPAKQAYIENRRPDHAILGTGKYMFVVMSKKFQPLLELPINITDGETKIISKVIPD
ncbi:MAG: RNA polymerase sigma factor [Gammaproteobacteria bacterium]|nr:RNA polymerase sigma factor [Gammaproteobacteria bacterium]